MSGANYHLPALAAARVLVAGDLMLDRYYTGSTTRISPEAPVPVVRIGADDCRPGGAANVALNLASLGVGTSLYGVIGDDEPGRVLRGLLERAGIGATLKLSPGRPTITKLRVLSRNQQLLRLDFEESFGGDPACTGPEWADGFRSLAEQADVVVLSDYAKGTLHEIGALIDGARSLGRPVVVDPKGDDFDRYRGATMLTPNYAEFEAVVGHCADEAAVVARGQALRARLELDALLITRSERGMTLLQAQGEAVHMPTQAREVFDVTGAGDTVVAVLAAGLATGLDPVHAARLANIAAGIVVGKLGTATVTRAELQASLWNPLGHESAVLDEAGLLERVARARGAGEVVVMTNGCFDVLHPGHVRYLEAARRLGDVLVVAVNDDDSVRRLKGEGRPLNTVGDRMAMLAALKSVDWVVAFAEDTPARLIEAVMPDLLVKGGDYAPGQIAGSEAVLAAGGEVVCLDFHPGYSTTALIEKARL